MKKLKIIISGGGTGGHIFPAVAIADALKKLLPGSEFLFIGAKGRMEMQKVPAAGYEIKGLWISGLQRRLTFKNILFPLKVISSIIKARSIIRDFKPNVVIGTGGYASGPTLRAAATMKIPTLIQEQNSFPGITNKLLSKKADKICVAYSGLEKWFPAGKIILTGNPVRKEFANFSCEPDKSREYFGLKSNSATLLVVGGSLGALTINKAILEGIQELRRKGISLIWQTGKGFYATAKEESAKHDNVKVFDFIGEMDKAYSAADIIISRAGAIAISELCCVGKAVILVPSPNVAEDHQTKNAMALVNNNAALMVKDSDAGSELIAKALQLIDNRDIQKELGHNILKLAKPNAAEEIANEVINLIKTL